MPSLETTSASALFGLAAKYCAIARKRGREATEEWRIATRAPAQIIRKAAVGGLPTDATLAPYGITPGNSPISARSAERVLPTRTNDGDIRRMPFLARRRSTW